MINPVVVTGKVRVTSPPNGLPQATLYVRLLDVSLIDTSARLIVEARIDTFDWSAASGDGVPFSLSASSIDPRAHYTVAALVDLDKDGLTGPNDYVSKQSHPVLTFGHPASAIITVERARP